MKKIVYSILLLTVLISVPIGKGFSQSNQSENLDSLMNMAYSFHKQGLKDSVEFYLTQIEDMANTALSQNTKNDTTYLQNIIKTLFPIATYYRKKRNNSERSFEVLNLIVQLAQKINDKKQLAKAYRVLGTNYELLSDYKKAIENDRKSANIYFELGDSLNASYAYIGIANVYKNWGQYDDALENYLVCYQLSRALNDSAGISMSSIGLGNIYSSKKEAKLALKYYAKSLGIAIAQHNYEGIALAQANIAQIYIGQQKYRAALGSLVQALRNSRLARNSLREVNILQLTGEVYMSTQNYDSAIYYLQKAYALSRKIESKKFQLLVLDDFSKLYKLQKDYKKALEYTDQYHLLKDSVFNENKFKEISLLETKFKTAEKNKQILLQKKEIESRNLRLKQERLIRYFIIIGLLIALAFSIYIFIIYRQRNEQIYF